MANSLKKNTVFIETIGYQEIPAKPYRPAVPPRTVYETREVCMFRYTGPGHYVYTYDPSTGQVTGTWIPDIISPGGPVGGETGVWACTTELIPVTYPGFPEQPYVPGQQFVVGSTFETGYNLGWNAGARSIAEFKNAGFVEFKVRADVVGVICGINFYDGVNSNYNGNTIDFAYYCARGNAWIMRNGVLGTGLGPYTEGTTFRIDRYDNEGIWNVEFTMDGDSKLIVTSGVPSAAGWLEASLYSGDDEVFDPNLVQVDPPDLTEGTGSMGVSFQPMSFFGAESSTYAAMGAEMPQPAMAMTSGSVTPSYAVANIALPPLNETVESLTGEIASLDAELPALKIFAADHPYSELAGELTPLTMSMSAYEGNENGSLATIARAASTMVSNTFLVATMNSVGTITSTMLVDAILDASMLSQASLGSTLAINSTIEAVMYSIATSGSVLDVPGSDNETWVINMDSNSTSTYTNYRFNSFAFINNTYFGAGEEGIVELVGDTDGGDPIRSFMSFGERDFNTRVRKTVQNAYLGTSAGGNLYIKLIAEGQEFIYKVRDYNPKLQQQRFTFGKGLRTNYVTVELYNEDGSDFELDTVEFIVADLSRKI